MNDDHLIHWCFDIIYRYDCSAKILYKIFELFSFSSANSSLKPVIYPVKKKPIIYRCCYSATGYGLGIKLAALNIFSSI